MRRTLFFVKQRLFTILSFLIFDHRTASSLRAALLRSFGVKVGKGCYVRCGPHFQEGFQLSIGDDCFVNAFCCFDTSAPISIGNRVAIAYQVTFITGSHSIGSHNSRSGTRWAKPIVVEDGVWIGARVTILPGIRIGAGAVIAAGALITKDVPPDSLVAGVPAQVIRSLT